MNVDENGPVAKATVQQMAGFHFVKYQDKDDNKEGLTILKNTTLASHLTLKDSFYNLYTCTWFE